MLGRRSMVFLSFVLFGSLMLAGCETMPVEKIEQKEAVIQNLNSQIDSLNKEIAALKQQIAQLQEKLSNKKQAQAQNAVEKKAESKIK